MAKKLVTFATILSQKAINENIMKEIAGSGKRIRKKVRIHTDFFDLYQTLGIGSIKNTTCGPLGLSTRVLSYYKGILEAFP
jgi:hypothetical protein